MIEIDGSFYPKLDLQTIGDTRLDEEVELVKIMDFEESNQEKDYCGKD